MSCLGILGLRGSLGRSLNDLYFMVVFSPVLTYAGPNFVSLSRIKRFLGNTTFQQTLEQCPLCKPYSFMSQT